MGPVFSGKTTELIRRIRREGLSGRETLVLKKKLKSNSESEGYILSHNEEFIEAKACEELGEIVKMEGFSNISVVGIDDAHLVSWKKEKNKVKGNV